MVRCVNYNYDYFIYKFWVYVTTYWDECMHGLWLTLIRYINENNSVDLLYEIGSF